MNHKGSVGAADVPESLPLSPSLSSCGGLAIAAARNLGRAGESEDTHQVTDTREEMAAFVPARMMGQRDDSIGQCGVAGCELWGCGHGITLYGGLPVPPSPPTFSLLF